MPARLFLVALIARAALAQPSPVFTQVDEMVATLSEITGWQIRKQVPSEMLSSEKFRRMVESGVKKSSADEDIRAEELTLKMFGFVPQDFNLKRESVDLVSEQAAAFYDYNKKRLYVLDTTPEGTEQQVALAHELAHALADQHHPLRKYIDQDAADDDASTARQAVMEGQATWLAWAYMSRHNGGKGDVSPALLDQVTSSAGAEGGDFPVFSSAPLYVRESLTFPYNQGMRFQDAVYQKLGRRSFDEVFLHPPRSTQQILHAERYLTRTAPSEVRPPPAAAVFAGEARRYKVLNEGTLGEFDHAVLLRQYAGDREGAEAARHWRGGAYRLFENKRDKFPVLAFASAWDSAESARSFFELYQKVLQGKWKKLEVTTRAPDEISGSGDTGRFRLRLSGDTVISVEGLR